MVIGVIPRVEGAAIRRTVHPITAPQRQLRRALESDMAGGRIRFGQQRRLVPGGHDLERTPGKNCLMMSAVALGDRGVYCSLEAVGAPVPGPLPAAR